MRPTITFAAILASGIPIALLTNGTVRDALGLTSRTYTIPPFSAHCTLINPRTFSAKASLRAKSFNCSITWTLSTCGIRTHALSPE